MTYAAAPAMHDWPICSALSPATSIDGSDPDLAAGRTALGIGDWKMALAALKLAEMRDPRNADIQHLAGYAYQRLGLFGPAIRHYQQALAFNRRHRSAHGDLGELYLALKEPFKSEAHLAMLEDICLIPCEELAALKRAIASYRALAVH